MELEESIKLAAEGCGVDLYDIQQTKENKTNILRVYITSKNGVNLDQCAHVSRMISPLLDIEEPISGKYTLEVSSPGIERKLKTLHHFQCSIGSNVKIKNYSNEVIKGELISATTDGILQIDENSEIKEIKYDDVLSASTYFDWNK
ncbi:ribosome maturation factor RimP [Arcobacter sp. 15-2]|uniref:ribosome maturation factor RimP n=1 Tax=Arcobacter sp. 15-2 TaxID=3374109 RepID=UPI00399CFF42